MFFPELSLKSTNLLTMLFRNVIVDKIPMLLIVFDQNPFIAFLFHELKFLDEEESKLVGVALYDILSKSVILARQFGRLLSNRLQGMRLGEGSSWCYEDIL